jgi:hypothetical protein
LPPVSTPVKALVLALVGISVRAVSGTDAAAPSGVVSWIDALTSPGCAGSLVLTATDLLCPGASVTDDGLTVPKPV